MDKCRVEIKPQSGEIGPDETVSISLCAEWKEVVSGTIHCGVWLFNEELRSSFSEWHFLFLHTSKD